MSQAASGQVTYTTVQVLVMIFVHADVNFCHKYIIVKEKITRMPLTNPVIKMHLNFKINPHPYL